MWSSFPPSGSGRAACRNTGDEPVEVLLFPAKREATLDRVYGIYWIIYPDLFLATGDGCLPGCFRQPGKESGKSCKSCLKYKKITPPFRGLDDGDIISALMV